MASGWAGRAAEWVDGWVGRPTVGGGMAWAGEQSAVRGCFAVGELASGAHVLNHLRARNHLRGQRVTGAPTYPPPRQAGVDVVVSTPGRAVELLRRGALSLGSTKAVVLDEVDVLCGECGGVVIVNSLVTSDWAPPRWWCWARWACCAA